MLLLYKYKLLTTFYGGNRRLFCLWIGWCFYLKSILFFIGRCEEIRCNSMIRCQVQSVMHLVEGVTLKNHAIENGFHKLHLNPLSMCNCPSLSYTLASDDWVAEFRFVLWSSVWKCFFAPVWISFYWFRLCLNWPLISFLYSNLWKLYNYVWQNCPEFIFSLFLDIMLNMSFFQHLVSLYLLARK